MIKVLQWLGMHGREIFETLALVISLYFTAASFRANTKERRISNLMTLAGNHRELWLHASEKSGLDRIQKPNVNLKRRAVTAVEKRFVHLLITNLAVSYAAMQDGVLPGLPGLQKDVRNFFSLPIPKEVWKWSRQFQEENFIAFVDRQVTPDASESNKRD